MRFLSQGLNVRVLDARLSNLTEANAPRTIVRYAQSSAAVTATAMRLEHVHVEVSALGKDRQRRPYAPGKARVHRPQRVALCALARSEPSPFSSGASATPNQCRSETEPKPLRLCIPAP